MKAGARDVKAGARDVKVSARDVKAGARDVKAGARHEHGRPKKPAIFWPCGRAAQENDVVVAGLQSRLSTTGCQNTF